MPIHSSHREGRRVRSGRFFAGWLMAGPAAAAALIAVLLAGFAAGPVRAEVEPVACDGLSIAVADGPPGTVRSCRAGLVMVSNGEGAPIPLSVEAIVEAGESSWQAVLSYAINGRAYLYRREVTAFLEAQNWFPEARNWGEVGEVGAFRTVRFEARPNEGGGYWQCVGFVRYSGPVPRSLGGFRRALGGAYCTNQNAPVSAHQVRGVLQALRY